jgi:hypothetical protein
MIKLYSIQVKTLVALKEEYRQLTGAEWKVKDVDPKGICTFVNLSK